MRQERDEDSGPSTAHASAYGDGANQLGSGVMENSGPRSTTTPLLFFFFFFFFQEKLEIQIFRWNFPVFYML